MNVGRCEMAEGVRGGELTLAVTETNALGTGEVGRECEGGARNYLSVQERLQAKREVETTYSRAR
jgi:hypothetical protein